MGTRVLVVAFACFACIALGACERVSTHYCEKNPMDYSHCPVPDGVLVGCTGPSGCPKTQPVCNVSLGACVECLADSDCKDPKLPRCDLSDNKCVECTSGADCPQSGICLYMGTCQTPDNTAYVDSSAPASNTDCTMASPCSTIEAGIAVGKPFVRVKGTFAETGGLTIPAAANVTLIGDPMASYQRTGNGAVITITAGATVGIQGFDISCDAGKMGVGISAGKTGTFSFSQLTVHDCAAGPGGGILVGGGSVSISRSKLYGNLYGISLAGATHFDITNNMIVHNGNGTTNEAAAGAMLGMGTGTDRFEFNTVSDNNNHMGANQVGGVSCPMNFAIPDNILSGNTISGAVPSSNASASCLITGSLPLPDDSTLNFVNTSTAPYDYHIQAGSVAIDRAPADPTVTDDYDGGMRPINTVPDFGADELGN